MTLPSITVAVCTWNRAELLRGCLEAMCALRVEAGIRWSVLVIDNNSTDHTQEVIRDFAAKLPLRGVRETRQGLSNARNRAIDEADSDYILWTDDDVRVPVDWVQNYVEAVVSYEWPAVLGGDIVPDFGAVCPSWLEQGWREVANAYAVREAPGHGVPIACTHLPFGANYATRMDLQRAHRYDPNLGRSGKGMLSGEEEAVMAKILMEGDTRPGAGRWLSNVEVIHKIEVFRQKLSYLREYFAGHGEVDRRQHLASDAASGKGTPRWMYRALVQQYLAYVRCRYLAKDVNWLSAYAKYAFTLGEIRAWRKAP